MWKSDGTSAGTQLVKDLYPGAESSNILLPTLFNDLYVFTAAHQSIQRYIWKSDGTSAGTVILKDHQGNGITSTEHIAVLKTN
ncbi:MAG: hypothetical protein IPO07_20770 [Haliscomenobacter sp.]|nr:hypothetical protein [Haliscomenobacter sp.]MBK9490949.1 hypothetical protein [Haliscomenobacter sp.]